MNTANDPFRRFLRDESASLSVELILILPLLIWGFLSVYTIFDVFRARNIALKGNYAISDLLSRETASINPTYLAGVAEVYKYLTQGDSATWIRVTQIYCTSDCESNDNRELFSDWSRATSGQDTYSTDDVNNALRDKVPLIGYGERVIMVETSVNYTAPFIPPMLKTNAQPGYDSGWGFMKSNTFIDTVFTEPRFGPQLCWTGVSGCP
ncbi:hypothetical protein [Maritimibacter sp. UBA3975]|uniref:hypothetical protein n=1 Tax=Maritimibacter sp. UBA3975 TaxID=1946833 RepID=UPI000C0B1376|nr:hypothetical protein [Maritimibacter sp. UBA3975]MAM61037.1 hypothetical protein [Maritimibacter sp.]|tara:strand:+ start:4529 stop:5155 length:627 start_codon:yes stop_codon:yes gene_type:complete